MIVDRLVLDRRRFLPSIAALFAMTIAVHAAPQSKEQRKQADWSRCQGVDVDNDARIAGCSAIIDAKHERGRRLAVAYCNRGVARGDKQGAVEDFRKALELQPQLQKPKDQLKAMGVKPQRAIALAATSCRVWRSSRRATSSRR